MFNPRYNYHLLSRATDNGKRVYNTPDGQRLPSVTTILSATKSEKDIAVLENWKKRIGVKRAQEITNEAANRGTRMHTYLEKYVKNGERIEKPSNPFAWASWDMANTVIESGLVNVNECWGTEVPLYYPKLYAGTTDFVGVHQNEDAIIDFKQSNKPKKTEWILDYFLQLVFYGLAHNEVYGTSIKKGVVMMCVKPNEIEPGKYVTGPQYQQWILEGTEWENTEQKVWERLEQYYTMVANRQK